MQSTPGRMYQSQVEAHTGSIPSWKFQQTFATILKQNKKDFFLKPFQTGS